MKTEEEIHELGTLEYQPWESNMFFRMAPTAYSKGYSQCQKDMEKDLYEFGKLVLDTFHSEGRTHSGEDRLSRIKFDEWFNSLNKQD